jgi:hypothetical protein
MRAGVAIVCHGGVVRMLALLLDLRRDGVLRDRLRQRDPLGGITIKPKWGC